VMTAALPDTAEFTRYLTAFDGHKIAGITKLFERPEMSNIHIDALEVAEAQRHQGIASLMLEHVFVEAADKGKAVTNNGFSDMGKQHLIHVQNRLAEKYRVTQGVVGRC
ncbi:MAG: GNAT family N-acetyltransferase, partial [Rickettsiales bacterium]